MTRVVLTLSAAWSSSGFQTENVRSEPSHDKGNLSSKPPRATVHAALARGGLDQGAYFTFERAHCENFAAKGLDRTTASRPEKRGLLSIDRQGPRGQEVTRSDRKANGRAWAEGEGEIVMTIIV
jgi:hypothetical protein